MKILIAGASGLVGRELLKAIHRFDLPADNLIVAASERSAGKNISSNKKIYTLLTMEEAIAQKPHIALFSAGSTVSLKYAPILAELGCTVIDNSSAWRMDKQYKLIVPEINAATLNGNDKIIANPNCSTIQLVMVLAPLHKIFIIRRIIISTYQSVTGTGIQAVRQLQNEQTGKKAVSVYPHPIHENCLPHCDDFTENGYTKEEMKLVNETKKILADDSIMITATAVRVPVIGGHCESVNIEFEKGYNLSEIKTILKNSPGVVVKDEPENNEYPTPKYSQNKDEVFVGRIRKDYSQKNSLNLWITADNLRKGAATNAVQIAKYIIDNKLV